MLCSVYIILWQAMYIALRGNIERRDQPGNPGKFLAMKLIANYNPFLKGHLENPR